MMRQLPPTNSAISTCSMTSSWPTISLRSSREDVVAALGQALGERDVVRAGGRECSRLSFAPGLRQRGHSRAPFGVTTPLNPRRRAAAARRRLHWSVAQSLGSSGGAPAAPPRLDLAAPQCVIP